MTAQVPAVSVVIQTISEFLSIMGACQIWAEVRDLGCCAVSDA
jgi:hypothetical protein